MKTVTVKLPEGLYARLAEESAARGVSKSEVLREAYGLRAGAANVSAWALLRRVAGAVHGPEDLSSNKGYLKGYGGGGIDRHRRAGRGAQSA